MRGRVRVPLDERLWSRVEKTETCWLWMGPTDSSGYGSIKAGGRGGKTLSTHRLVYEMFKGPIPKGLEVNHLCRNRLCLNPDHLEATTHRNNCLYGPGKSHENARKTHCPQGHPYDEENTRQTPAGNHRMCKTCTRARDRERYLAKKAAA